MYLLSLNVTVCPCPYAAMRSGGTVTGEKGSKLMSNRVRYCEVWWGSGYCQVR